VKRPGTSPTELPVIVWKTTCGTTREVDSVVVLKEVVDTLPLPLTAPAEHGTVIVVAMTMVVKGAGWSVVAAPGWTLVTVTELCWGLLNEGAAVTRAGF